MPSAYRTLVNALGVNNVLILSAGWGLVAAHYLLPDYDITFSSSARGQHAYKRCKPTDKHRDFSMLPQDTAKHVFFFGDKDYLALFCTLTNQHPAAHRVHQFQHAAQEHELPNGALRDHHQDQLALRVRQRLRQKVRGHG